MIYKISTSKALDEIEQRLQESAARHRFGVIAIHDLRDTLKKKGVDLAMECRIFEVCNPLQAKKVLEADGGISTALPCRISAYGVPGAYTLATMRPTEMMKGFHSPGIEPVAREVEEVIFEMMRYAAGNEPATIVAGGSGHDQTKSGPVDGRRTDRTAVPPERS